MRTRLGRSARLGLWLFLTLAFAVAVGVPSALLARERGEDLRAERDARIERLALETLFSLEEDRENPGEIDLGAYVSAPRPGGDDVTAVLDTQGRILAGDVIPPNATRRRAAERGGRGEEAPLTLPGSEGEIRIVAVSVEGEEETLGVVVAFTPADAVESEVRAEERRIGLLALAGWLALTALSILAVRRALRPKDSSHAAMSAFLADAAHELRTPWAIVRGRAERGLRGSSPEQELEAIERTAATAAETIADMLQLARLDAGQGLAEREPIRLDALVGSCAEEHSEEAARAGVELRVSVPEPVIVAGDERLLEGAVANLIENALRHGGAGGYVEVAVERRNGEASVMVADRGPGIPPGQRERIFDRFHRGSTTAAGGSGLGLPIVRLVAEAHGGAVEVEPPAVGEAGARFVLRLPAQ